MVGISPATHSGRLRRERIMTRQRIDWARELEIAYLEGWRDCLQDTRYTKQPSLLAMQYAADVMGRLKQTHTTETCDT